MLYKIGLSLFLFLLLFNLIGCTKTDINSTPIQKDFRDSITGTYSFTGNCINTIYFDTANRNGGPPISGSVQNNYGVSGSFLIEKSSESDSMVLIKSIMEDPLSVTHSGIIFTADSLIAKERDEFFRGAWYTDPTISVSAKFANNQLNIPKQYFFNIRTIVATYLVGTKDNSVLNREFEFTYKVVVPFGGRCSMEYDLLCRKQ